MKWLFVLVCLMHISTQQWQVCLVAALYAVVRKTVRGGEGLDWNVSTVQCLLQSNVTSCGLGLSVLLVHCMCMWRQTLLLHLLLVCLASCNCHCHVCQSQSPCGASAGRTVLLYSCVRAPSASAKKMKMKCNLHL